MYIHTYVCEYVHNARLLICFQGNFWLRHFWRIENKSYTICMLYKYLNINNDWLYDGKTTKFVVEWLEGHTLWHILVLLLSVLIKIIVLFFPFPPLPIRIVPLDVRCCEWCSIIITTNKKQFVSWWRVTLSAVCSLYYTYDVKARYECLCTCVCVLYLCFKHVCTSFTHTRTHTEIPNSTRSEYLS